MTSAERSRRLSITLPEDVAKVLDDQPNASAYIAESLRLRSRRENAVRAVTEAGYDITQAGIDAMRTRIDTAQARQREDRANPAA